MILPDPFTTSLSMLRGYYAAAALAGWRFFIFGVLYENENSTTFLSEQQSSWQEVNDRFYASQLYRSAQFCPTTKHERFLVVEPLTKPAAAFADEPITEGEGPPV